ncbi:TPA_asm: virulence protein SpvA [Salmonella enterica subsp. enterica serovar Typhimurium]|uniref:Virulence protein SpvA n=3 Tax=Salmonella enterica TaxID=28901 RepID=A0A736WD77_SALTM|nr:virulence protein SpvA [Salmonella enterica]EGP3767350.1 virulence protein SpvA [Salmonella enterica]EGU2348364.1 virulence protein SpvA [Salmonella enterica]MBL6163180.1 virulence protein SpvA [Salmonella enterica subsp. enterica serovar Typhimurium]HAC6358043.1 virulence protein SpvA [Salmonella enterica subsp. enterica serovar Typhimurium]HAE4214162.1 virulence protein SpvA [Salmonella enterica subsp. enterica serovar Typhimurium]
MNMNQTTSPALSQVETAIRVPAGNFAKYNYYSVFDIVRQTRKQFINANMSWPGSRGGKTWDLAMGQAQYIRCMFRENQLTRRVRGTLQQTPDNGTNLSSSAVGGIQGQAERRPDLATLMVVNDAINQQIPPLLPYHFPHDQVELSLLNTDVSLEDIISESSIDWPWFLSNSLTGDNSNYAMELASRLSPEQQTLPTEPDNSTATDLTSFYQTNLGLKTADYTPFEALNTFARQLAITVPPGGTVDCGYSACQPAV